MTLGRRYLQELMERTPSEIADDPVNQVKRKAGEYLSALLGKGREIDDAYSERIQDMYRPLVKDGKAEGLKGLIALLGSTVGGGMPSTRKFAIHRTVNPTDIQERIENVVAPAMEYGLPAASAVSKYAIPAAGVALAGRGVMDIAAGFGGPADQQESGQITINDLPQAAQSLIKGNPGEQIVAGMRGYGPYANLSQGELEQMLEAVNNTAFYQ